MKAFDEWYGQFNTATMSQTETMLQQRAWRAALEWVLKINEGTFMPSRYTIEEELLSQQSNNQS